MATVNGTGRKLLASKVGITKSRDQSAKNQSSKTLTPKQAQHGKTGSRLT